MVAGQPVRQGSKSRTGMQGVRSLAPPKASISLPVLNPGIKHADIFKQATGGLRDALRVSSPDVRGYLLKATGVSRGHDDHRSRSILLVS